MPVITVDVSNKIAQKYIGKTVKINDLLEDFDVNIDNKDYKNWITKNQWKIKKIKLDKFTGMLNISEYRNKTNKQITTEAWADNNK